MSANAIKRAIVGFKLFKSAGPALLQRLNLKRIELLGAMFIASVQMNHVPSELCRVRIIFIPKAGRNSHTTLQDFRHVCPPSY